MYIYTFKYNSLFMIVADRRHGNANHRQNTNGIQTNRKKEGNKNPPKRRR